VKTSKPHDFLHSLQMVVPSMPTLLEDVQSNRSDQFKQCFDWGEMICFAGKYMDHLQDNKIDKMKHHTWVSAEFFKSNLRLFNTCINTMSIQSQNK